jgi:VIT1/CCC1 family predicted Fe2+/Mn2+ transporter
MAQPSSRNRVLSPLERFSEIVFGLIMVLTFTCAMSVANVGREDVRLMLIGAIGCNFAWGIIDAAFYLVACVVEHGRRRAVLLGLQNAKDPAEAQKMIASALPEPVAAALQPQDLDRIRQYVQKLPTPPVRPRLTAENWRNAAGVFLLVFAATFPVVLPFLIFDRVPLALRTSNAVAVVMLFGAGWQLARYAGLPPARTGGAMVVLGMVLVGVAIALGG